MWAFLWPPLSRHARLTLWLLDLHFYLRGSQMHPAPDFPQASSCISKLAACSGVCKCLRVRSTLASPDFWQSATPTSGCRLDLGVQTRSFFRLPALPLPLLTQAPNRSAHWLPSLLLSPRRVPCMSLLCPPGSTACRTSETRSSPKPSVAP